MSENWTDLSPKEQKLFSENNNKNFHWKPEEVLVLKTLHEQKCFVSEIAKKLGCTQDRVSRKLWQMKKHRTRDFQQTTWSLLEERTLKEMFEKNDSIEKISKKLNKSASSIKNKIYNLRLKRRQNIDRISQNVGRKTLQSLGYTIVSEGDTLSPFDFVVSKNGTETYVNVKVGTRCVINERNLERLRELKVPFYFMFITKKQVYFFKEPVVEKVIE
jgi:predicted transcriptional regulator